MRYTVITGWWISCLSFMLFSISLSMLQTWQFDRPCWYTLLTEDRFIHMGQNTTYIITWILEIIANRCRQIFVNALQKCMVSQLFRNDGSSSHNSKLLDGFRHFITLQIGCIKQRKTRHEINNMTDRSQSLTCRQNLKNDDAHTLPLMNELLTRPWTLTIISK